MNRHLPPTNPFASKGLHACRFVRAGVALSLILLVLAGCASKRSLNRANDAMEQGDYFAAASSAVDVLEKKPDNADAQAILIQALPQGVAQVDQDIQTRAASTRLGDLDYVAERYNALVALNARIDALRLVSEESGEPVTVETFDYRAQRDSARTRAAEGYYQRGRTLGDDSTSTRAEYKDAARAMQRAHAYRPGYRDARTRYAQYREAATRRVVVAMFDQPVNYDRYGALGSIVVTDALSDLEQDAEAMEFVEIVGVVDPNVATTTTTTQTQSQDSRVTPMSVLRQAIGLDDDGGSRSQVTTQQRVSQRSYDVASVLTWARQNEADLVLVGRVEQVVMGAPRTTTKPTTELKDIKVGTETYIDEDGKKRKRDVTKRIRADGTHYTMTTRSSMRVSFQLLRADTGAIEASDTVEGTHSSEYEWARFRGDRRAVDGDYEDLMKREEGVPPSASERLPTMLRRASGRLAVVMKRYLQ